MVISIGEVRPAPFEPNNVAQHLAARAAQHPDDLAVAVGIGGGHYRSVTLDELNRHSDRIAHGLERLGVCDGTRTVLMVTPSPEFFALTFALFKVKAIVVMVDPGMGIKNLRQCLAEAEPQAFIGVPKAHLARILFGWAKKSLCQQVTVGRRLLWGGPTLKQIEVDAAGAYPTRDTDPEDVAAILFTSGSTGVPKGVLYRHAMFAAQVRVLREVYGIEPGERDLSTFPLFALFGPALGMASVVPPMDASRPGTADPSDLVAAVRDYACTSMFVSPILVDKIGRHCEAEGERLPSLRRVISAGAPASPPALERLGGALKSTTQIYTPYGATEALPVSSIGSDAILKETRVQTDAGKGVCVGLPVESIDLAIIAISDEPIAQWSDALVLGRNQIGEIVVAGEVVSRAYYNRQGSTELAKITDGDILRHRMGDVGYVDDLGRLWMCGRMAHRVQTKARTLFTIPVEAVFNTHPDVLRTALVGISQQDDVRPVLCVELESGVARAERPRIERQLGELGAVHAHTADIDTFLFRRSFPVDVRHNAKIFREQLAVWAKDKLP